MAEHPIEEIHPRLHQQVVGTTAPLVALGQHKLMPVGASTLQQVAPAGHIFEAEVDPLPRQRVDGVGGIAKQHHPTGVVVVGVAAHQREAPLAGDGKAAEPTREVAAHFGSERLVAHGRQRPDPGRAVIPHQGAVLAG